jgi:aspartyl/glutamyl-tRNA(Asn/Gln) amidotransferase C subunit
MISKQQVEHMAKLARIELTENEKKKFQKELSSILDYVKQLNRVDTNKVERIAQITGLENVVRDDESGIKNRELRKKILKNVPSKKGDYIKVPKILE